MDQDILMKLIGQISNMLGMSQNTGNYSNDKTVAEIFFFLNYRSRIHFKPQRCKMYLFFQNTPQ